MMLADFLSGLGDLIGWLEGLSYAELQPDLAGGL
jgi:hypothetical protein